MKLPPKQTKSLRISKRKKRKPRCPFHGCSKSFCSLFSLRRHKNTVHMKLREFTCPLCAKTFTQKQHMLAHLRRHRISNPPTADTETPRQKNQIKFVLLPFPKSYETMLQKPFTNLYDPFEREFIQSLKFLCQSQVEKPPMRVLQVLEEAIIKNQSGV